MSIHRLVDIRCSSSPGTCESLWQLVSDEVLCSNTDASDHRSLWDSLVVVVDGHCHSLTGIDVHSLVEVEDRHCHSLTGIDVHSLVVVVDRHCHSLTGIDVHSFQ